MDEFVHGSSFFLSFFLLYRGFFLGGGMQVVVGGWLSTCEWMSEWMDKQGLGEMYFRVLGAAIAKCS